MLVSASGAAGQSDVVVTDLGVAGTATAVNAAGTVVGNTVDGEGEQRPFVWARGTVTTIGDAPASAVDINDEGRVLGSRTVRYVPEGDDPRPPFDYAAGWTWRDGTYTELSGATSFVGLPVDVTVTALNNQGLSVGHYFDGMDWEPRASVALWDRSGRSTGPVPSPGAINVALDLNDRGQILAVGYHSHWCHVVVAGSAGQQIVGGEEYPDWEATGLGCQSWARLNNRGEVLTPDKLWRNGDVVELDTLMGADVTATAFSDRGHITGQMDVGGQEHAVLWDGQRLHDLGPGSAEDVNRRGVVVGSRDGRAVMWTVQSGSAG